MKILMIGHLLGDFYFQTNKLAEKKKKSLVYTMLHCFIYCFVMLIVLITTTGKLVENTFLALLMGGLHLVVDGIKCELYKRKNLGKYELTVFIIDQIIHLVILFLVNCVFDIEFNIAWNQCISVNVSKVLQNSLTFVFSFLLCGKPAALIVSLVFGLIPKTIESAENDVVIIGKKRQESIRIGSWIGILEREIILILGVLGQYGAIGFVIAAKSLARHSQLNEPAFAEKYLIGTLLSSLIALLGVLACSIL